VGERRRRDEVGAIPKDEARVGQRHRFDDAGSRPSYASQVEADGGINDLCHRLEVVLQGVPEGMWSHIQDERVLEPCVGGSAEWRTLIPRAAVEGVAMTGQLPCGPGGPPAGGVPPANIGPSGGALGNHEC
jgi:hypothetical protein